MAMRPPIVATSRFDATFGNASDPVCVRHLTPRRKHHHALQTTDKLDQGNRQFHLPYCFPKRRTVIDQALEHPVHILIC